MLDAQRLAVLCSNLLSVDRGHQYSPIDWKQAYQLATLGGARGKITRRCSSYSFTLVLNQDRGDVDWINLIININKTSPVERYVFVFKCILSVMSCCD